MRIAIVILSLVLLRVDAEEGKPTELARSRRTPVFFGQKAAITLFPYYVAIEVYLFGPFGGGSIISENFVLTAAHLFDYKKEMYLVRAGSDKWGEGGSKHDLDYYEIHPDYVQDDGAGGSVNDIALVRVQNPFKFDTTRQPIPLYRFKNALRPGTPAIVVGLGYTEKGRAAHLMSNTIWVQDRVECDKVWSKNGTLPTPKSAICAGGGNGRRDTCEGDSGGPFVIREHLAGVTSFGHSVFNETTGNYKCGFARVPAFYTEVTQFLTWIDKRINDTLRPEFNELSPEEDNTV